MTKTPEKSLNDLTQDGVVLLNPVIRAPVIRLFVSLIRILGIQDEVYRILK